MTFYIERYAELLRPNMIIKEEDISSDIAEFNSYADADDFFFDDQLLYFDAFIDISKDERCKYSLAFLIKEIYKYKRFHHYLDYRRTKILEESSLRECKDEIERLLNNLNLDDK